MSYGYGRPNPYDQRDAGSGGGGGGGYGGPPGASFGQNPSYGRAGNNMEMSSYPGGSQGGYGGGSGMGGGSGNSNNILDECRKIDLGINEINENLDRLQALQQQSLNAADTSGTSGINQDLDRLSTETMNLYRALTNRVRKLKSNSEAQKPMNAPQVNRIDRRLKAAINSYQQIESTFRKKNRDQMERQYRIVRPEADDSEVQAAIEDTTGQVFQQALMQSSRLGNAQRTLGAVKERHQQIQQIERQMMELAQLFQDMDTLIIQQEVAVAQIEQKAEEVVENLDKGNEEVQTAVTTARATRRKKWWCLLICILIVVVIVAAVLIYLAVTGKFGNKSNNNNNNQKRGMALTVDDLGTIVLRKTIPSFTHSRVARRMIGNSIVRT